MTNYKVFHFNLLQAACTVLWGNDLRCAITDPGCSTASELEELEDFISRERLTPVAVLLTHGHPDHLCGAAAVSRRYGVPVWLSPTEQEYLPVFQRYGRDIGMQIDVGFPTSDAMDGSEIPIGEELRLRVISTPGHSAGGVCYYDPSGQILIAGDTLFAGCIGRSDLHGGDYDTLIRGILDRLMPLPPDTLVIPGHGALTTIGAEAGSNPFLEPFNEPLPEEG